MIPILLSALVAIPHGMASIPGGSYKPLFAMTANAHTTVSAFAIDREPVTRGEFLRFVRTNPQWRRGSIKSSLAERSYLNDWRGDLDAGDAASLAQPVRNVSWFAARAYCVAQGKRLPTTDEWEYVASASETRRDATNDPAFVQRLLDITTSHHGVFRNVYGVSGLHGGLWEWTADYNGGHMHPVHHHDLNCAGAALGSSDPSNYPAFLRSAVRSALTDRDATQHVGFRCAAG
jgi:formylglycine-generating enzyme required for sulfatase activity